MASNFRPGNTERMTFRELLANARIVQPQDFDPLMETGILNGDLTTARNTSQPPSPTSTINTGEPGSARRPDMTTKDLMEAFPIVEQDALGENTTCPCCYVEYGKGAVEGEEGEQAIRTPCNHIIGYECLQAWLPNNNSCPACRGELIDRHRYALAFGSDDHSDSGLELNFDRFGLGLDSPDPYGTPDPLPDHLILEGSNAALPPLIIRADVTGYTVDGERLLANPLRMLQDAADRQRDHPDANALTERRVIVERVQAPEYDGEDRMFLNAELLRLRTRREWKLYQELSHQDNDIRLPPTRWFGDDLGGALDWRQDRALFHELQRRGAFDYPGMRQHYVNGDGTLKPDAVVFHELRDAGACWSLSHHWTVADDGVLWSEINHGFFQPYDSPVEESTLVRDDGFQAVNMLAKAMGTSSFDSLTAFAGTWDSQESSGRGRHDSSRF